MPAHSYTFLSVPEIASNARRFFRDKLVGIVTIQSSLFDIASYILTISSRFLHNKKTLQNNRHALLPRCCLILFTLFLRTRKRAFFLWGALDETCFRLTYISQSQLICKSMLLTIKGGWVPSAVFCCNGMGITGTSLSGHHWNNIPCIIFDNIKNFIMGNVKWAVVLMVAILSLWVDYCCCGLTKVPKLPETRWGPDGKHSTSIVPVQVQFTREVSLSTIYKYNE